MAVNPAADLFLKAVLRSGLLNPEQLHAACNAAPVHQRDNPTALAEHFIKTGKLTRFQAVKLLAGRARGLILGPYQLLAPIGRGGMGAVYLVRDSRNQQLAALKVLPPKKARREERLLARFQREMELCQRVAHPHIARTFEVGVKAGVYYIAMEFIPGKDLSNVVREHGPLGVPRAARLFGEVATGLQHAHEQGLVHRDIKPSNIRITPHDRAKVLDLGLALLEGEEMADREVIGGQGYIVGSMDFIAPEQTLDACNVDGRADIYALGCSLYFTLTGQPPFPGGTIQEKIQRHRRTEPAPLTERNPALPVRFAELVHRMMAKDPQRRLATAAAVQRELQAWASSEREVIVDHPDDTAYRLAITTLQTADVDDDLEAIPLAEPVKFTEAPMFLWIVVGVVGVWMLLVMVAMLALMLR